MNLHRPLAIAILALCLASCDNFLRPEAPSQISLSNFWKTPADATLGVAAVYDDVQGAFEQNYWRWGELRADNFIKNDRPPTDVQQVIDNGLTPNTAGADWSSLYRAIASANIAIAKIPEIDAFNAQDDLLAQALTLRALSYFYAVRVWGAVPKITEPITELDYREGQPRSPSSEIFAEIILPDIARAEELVSAARSRLRPRNEISLGAILALKAHVYMWPGSHQDNTIARDALSQLEAQGYQLEETEAGWTSIFRGAQNSSEIVFALAWDYNQDGGNGGVGTFVSATPSYVPSEDLEQKWVGVHATDFRRPITATFDIEIENVAEFPFHRILSKYSGRFDQIGRDEQGAWGRENGIDIVFYRLSELLLLKAEAENNLGNTASALALVNRVRRARGVDPIDESITSTTAVRDIILDERQFELMGEGHRFWDLVRNGVVLDVMSPVNGMSSEDQILWPVSQNVLNRNANIDQNRAY